MNQLKDYSSAQLREIISIKERIESLECELTRLVGGTGDELIQTRTRRGPRRMSAAARRKISLAQKARWAKKRERSQSRQSKKRRMSAAGRARIAAAAKARWARVNAASKV